MKRLYLCLCAVILLGFWFAHAEACPAHRSQAAITAFKKTHACPATGTILKSREACPGYVIDHIKPLCLHGKDAPSNMQWQTLADSYAKDAQERAACAAKRKR